MKIEIGENLMRSWLRHVKGCQLAELNWKPSSEWPKHQDFQELMDRARSFFVDNLGVEIFKQTTGAFQLLKQAEMDVLGMRLSSSGCIDTIYGVDVAYHEAGLNYEDNVGRILKKLFRGRMAIRTFFGEAACQMVFASPFVKRGPLEQLVGAVEKLRIFLNESRIETVIYLYANEEFKKEILEPTLQASMDTADTSELFLRSFRLIDKLGLVKQVPPVTTGNVDRSKRGETRMVGGNSEDGAVKPDKIRRWASNPYLKVHRIIGVLVRHGSLTRDRFAAEVQRLGITDGAYGSIASLMTNAGNAYGRVFIEQGNLICFHPEIMGEIGKHQWRGD